MEPFSKHDDEVELWCVIAASQEVEVKPTREYVVSHGEAFTFNLGQSISSMIEHVQTTLGLPEGTVFSYLREDNGFFIVNKEQLAYAPSEARKFYLKAKMPQETRELVTVPKDGREVDRAVLDQILEPFSPSEMCTGMDTSSLNRLLQTPLRRKIPMVYNLDMTVAYPEIFECSREMHATGLQVLVAGFLKRKVRKGLGEVISSGLYSGVLMDMIETVTDLLDIPLALVGDKAEDPSYRISSGMSRRDVRISLNSVPVLQFEFKDVNLSAAVKDMQEKHLGCAACVYGDLQYIFGGAANGSDLQFLIVPLNSKGNIIKILDQLRMDSREHRTVFMIAVFNLFRWIRTIHRDRLLCTSGLAFLTEHLRVSPWDSMKQVSVTLGLNHARKCFQIPAVLGNDFIELYNHLNGSIPGAIRVEDVFVDSVPRRSRTPKRPFVKSVVQEDGWYSVELHLVPVGCQVQHDLEEELVLNVVETILNCLMNLHNLGFCHYDVRIPNKMKHNNTFYLLDFEMAGKIDQRVRTLASPYWKEGCGWSYKVENDLYMLGTMISDFTNSPNWLIELGTKLKDGTISSTEEALDVLKTSGVNATAA